MNPSELIQIRKLASGDSLEIPVYRFKGNAKGPTAYLQASLHGSEVQGNWVIAELLERLPKIEVLGDITLVPCANPHGQNQKMGDYTMGRYDPSDGDNWNRAFQDLSHLTNQVDAGWPKAKEQLKKLLLEELSKEPKEKESHAKHLARTLQRLSCTADFMLDLHCAALCESYVYVPAYAIDSFKDLPCRHAVQIHTEFTGAMDEAFEAPWWEMGKKIEEATLKFPKGVPEGFTLELGHQDWSDPELAKKQAEGILYFLAKKGVVKGKFKKMEFATRYACNLEDFKTDYAPTGGFVKLKAKLGEVQRKGEPYVEFLGFKNYERKTIPIPEKRVTLVFTNAASVHEGTEMGKSLTRFFKIT